MTTKFSKLSALIVIYTFLTAFGQPYKSQTVKFTCKLMDKVYHTYDFIIIIFDTLLSMVKIRMFKTILRALRPLYVASDTMDKNFNIA